MLNHRHTLFHLANLASLRSEDALRGVWCAQTNLKLKKGMRFITIFFVIPICPVSGVNQIAQCPNCGTRYQAA